MNQNTPTLLYSLLLCELNVPDQPLLAAQLVEACESDEEVDAHQVVVDGDDLCRVPAPMIPVADSAHCWLKDTFSTGRLMSARPAATSPHLKVGAQKWIVFGPAGWFQKAASLVAADIAIAAGSSDPA
eukprot:CAMPEP_0173393718 /NCGR_PEP_ID=MMETSP1356-20130122/22273_1 /TAXON_ID=77927 ORGANISM="Hemiselmis virescens, Strain PCC157" /NCGR_SAMPLE_ID=MMETSP1356 /ASSEMBLY_ACC=CAM_ASM_000847 /LENGTH=127 /DNA_ID=CAMNT_0014351783 /DNA_START=113 /DNA_END=493 /DNA_ORIENTATION=+